MTQHSQKQVLSLLSLLKTFVYSKQSFCMTQHNQKQVLFLLSLLKTFTCLSDRSSARFMLIHIGNQAKGLSRDFKRLYSIVSQIKAYVCRFRSGKAIRIDSAGENRFFP